MPKIVTIDLDQLEAALAAHQGNRTRAAADIGCSVATLKKALAGCAGLSKKYPPVRGRPWY